MAKYNPREMFVLANVFGQASGVLLAASPTFAVPLATCAALSCELYMKCLITLEQGKPPRDHDLQILFGLISAQNQAKVRVAYGRRSAITAARWAMLPPGIPTPPLDFDEVLSKSKDAFEHLRYIYEGSIQVGDGWLAGDVTMAVQEIILEAHPEWSNV